MLKTVIWVLTWLTTGSQLYLKADDNTIVLLVTIFWTDVLSSQYTSCKSNLLQVAELNMAQGSTLFCP